MKKMKRNNENRKKKRKEKKNDLAVLPSHDMNTLSLSDTHMEVLSIAYHKYMCFSTKSRYYLWEVY